MVALEFHSLTACVDCFLDLDALPQRLVFVGGGYVSFEFAHVSVRAGAHVSILHRGPKPLVRFDPDLVDRLVVATRELGVEIQTQAEVRAVTKSAGVLGVHASTPAGERVFEADMVVHGAGRVPDTKPAQRESAQA